MPVNNVTVIQNGTAGVSTSNPFPVTVTLEKVKETTQVLGTGVSASITLASAAVVNMVNWLGGSLEVAPVSGTSGTFSIAQYTCETEDGDYVLANQLKSDKSGYENIPAIVTTAGTKKSYSIPDIRAKFLKFVITLTGTAAATFKFTPTKK